MFGWDVVRGLYVTPTEYFAISEPRNQSIHVSEVIKTPQSTDFEHLKMKCEMLGREAASQKLIDKKWKEENAENHFQHHQQRSTCFLFVCTIDPDFRTSNFSSSNSFKIEATLPDVGAREA